MESDQSEEQLIEKAKAGEQEAFESLVKQYLPIIYRYLVRLTGNSANAEDLAQETFLRVWKNLQHFDKEKKFLPWVFRIARNHAYDFFRKRKKVSFSELPDYEQLWLNNLHDDAPTPSQNAEASEITSEIKRTLHNLSKNEQEILTLHYFENLTTQEISQMLNLPYETVKTRLRRARTAFREHEQSNSEPTRDSNNVLLSKNHANRSTTDSPPIASSTSNT